jgi:hypothetical protein
MAPPGEYARGIDQGFARAHACMLSHPSAAASHFSGQDVCE